MEWLPYQSDINHVYRFLSFSRPDIWSLLAVGDCPQPTGKPTTHPYVKVSGAINGLEREPNEKKVGGDHAEGSRGGAHTGR